MARVRTLMRSQAAPDGRIAAGRGQEQHTPCLLPTWKLAPSHRPSGKRLTVRGCLADADTDTDTGIDTGTGTYTDTMVKNIPVLALASTAA